MIFFGFFLPHSLKNRTLTFFMLKLLLFLFAWMGFKYMVGPDDVLVEDKHYPKLANIWMHFQQMVREVLIFFNKIFLRLMGFRDIYEDHYTIAVKGYGGVLIGDPCLAIEMMALYAALILATNASFKAKVIGILLGIAGIQTINFIRIFGLNLMTIYLPQYANIAHHYLFNTVEFLAILLMFNFFLNYQTKN